MKAGIKKQEVKFIVTDEYREWIALIKDRIRNSQIKASIKVNRELLELYCRVTSDGAPYESLWQWNDGDETELPDHNANVYYTGSFGKLSVDFNGDFLQTETSKSSTKEIGRAHV